MYIKNRWSNVLQFLVKKNKNNNAFKNIEFSVFHKKKKTKQRNHLVTSLCPIIKLLTFINLRHGAKLFLVLSNFKAK